MKLNFDNKKELFASLLQFIKFGIVGLSNTLVALVIYYIFIYINEDLYLVGNCVGWIVSVFNAFYWSNKYVFTSENHSFLLDLKKLLKTYVTYGFTFILTTVLLYVEVNIFDLSKVICPFVNMIITIPVNFLLNKFWAYKDNKNAGEGE